MSKKHSCAGTVGRRGKMGTRYGACDNTVAGVLSAEHVVQLVEEAQERARVLGRGAGRRAA